MTQLDALAEKLLSRNLVSSPEEARALAQKFLDIDVRSEQAAKSPQPLPETSGEADTSVVQTILYFERVALEPQGRAVFANARVEPEPQKASSPRPIEPEPMRAPSAEVDLTSMFHVDNLKKHASS